tara:strand:+ start:300 stop:743 length:444 start_codon:yes stop_codon:yes gene_type:complete
MIVSFVGDIDASMHGLKDVKQSKQTTIANVNGINLSKLKYNAKDVNERFPELVSLCIELFQSGELVYLTNLLRILYHHCRKDVSILQQALGIEGLCELIPERTKNSESNGTSPEALAMKHRNCRIMRTCLENRVKTHSNYIVQAEDS